MDRSRAVMDGLLTFVLVMLMLSVFSHGTVTVPMQSGAALAIPSDADESTWDEITARIAELFSSL
jgi:hypothetical protein